MLVLRIRFVVKDFSKYVNRNRKGGLCGKEVEVLVAQFMNAVTLKL